MLYVMHRDACTSLAYRNVNRVNTWKHWGFPDFRTNCLQQIQVPLEVEQLDRLDDSRN